MYHDNCYSYTNAKILKILGETSSTVNEAHVEIVSNSTCQQTYSFFKDGMICAGAKNESNCMVSKLI